MPASPFTQGSGNVAGNIAAVERDHESMVALWEGLAKLFLLVKAGLLPVRAQVEVS